MNYWGDALRCGSALTVVDIAHDLRFEDAAPTPRSRACGHLFDRPGGYGTGTGLPDATTGSGERPICNDRIATRDRCERPVRPRSTTNPAHDFLGASERTVSQRLNRSFVRTVSHIEIARSRHGRRHTGMSRTRVHDHPPRGLWLAGQRRAQPHMSACSPARRCWLTVSLEGAN